jgi:hypothetical protein
MARFELELDDKGELVGQLPAEIDAILKRIEITAHGTGFRSGQGKAAEDAKKQIEEAIKAERAKIEATLPLEREKWQSVEEENKALKTQLTDTMRESGRTLTKREEAHAEEITKRAEALKKFQGRIQRLTLEQVKSEAIRAGARDESLPELEAILGASIRFDDDMEPQIVNQDGSQATVHGKPMDLSTFVKSYIESHPWHRKPTQGAGGNARGGASFHNGGSGPAVSAQAIKDRIDNGDRSAGTINDLFEATRAKRAS